MLRNGLAVLVGVLASSILGAAAHASVAVPITGTAPNGRTYPQLGDSWWQWVSSITIDDNPLFYDAGSGVPIGGEANVWFLAPNLGGTTARQISPPEGTYLFFPVLTTMVLNGPGEHYTEAQMRDQLSDFHSATSMLEATVDGELVPDLWNYRASSPAGGFQVVLPLFNIFGIAGGTYGPPAVADGWWLLLEPLAPGQHTLSFQSAVGDPDNYDTQQATTYLISVTPEPTGVWVLALVAVGLVRPRR